MESEARREQIEDLVAGYIDLMNRGERLTSERVHTDHPDLAEEILDHLESFVDLGSSRDPAEPLGTLGDYTLRRQIGRGGMGVVYEAWQNSMDRQVALKVMPKAIAVDTRAVARFIQEAQLAGKLSHPNIVHVHGMGVEQQIPYYAMEFVLHSKEYVNPLDTRTACFDHILPVGIRPPRTVRDSRGYRNRWRTTKRNTAST